MEGLTQARTPSVAAGGTAGGAKASVAWFAEALGRQRHLLAVRDGVVAALPLVLIGSAFLLVAQLPSKAWQEFVAPISSALLLPYKMLGGLVSLYVCLGTARSLARRYELDGLSAGLVALASFLVALSPVPLAVENGRQAWGVSAEKLGAGGIFGALFVAILSVEIQHFISRRRWTIRLPPSAPDAIAKSFASIVPGFASVTLVWLLVHVLGANVVDLLTSAVRPLIGATDSLPGVLTLALIDSGMWLLGVHPMAVLATVKPLWLQMLAANMEAAAAGVVPPHVGTRELFLWFVWQGGSGGTLAAALVLLRARSKVLRGVAKVGILPAIFNINEPILFGLPIVMNPRLAIPFVLAPLCSAAVAFLAMSAGLVARPRLEVLWTLPAPVGAFLSTGGDPWAVALQCANLGVAALVWWPFLRRYDQSVMQQEVVVANETPGG